MTNYTALLNRIRAAETRKELAKWDKQITRHYNAGTITAREFSRLDREISERVFILDTIPTNPTIPAP